MVGHAAALDADFDQGVQLGRAVEAQPDAHGAHGGPAAARPRVERDTPAVRLPRIQLPGAFQGRGTWSRSHRAPEREETEPSAGDGLGTGEDRAVGKKASLCIRDFSFLLKM